MGNIKPIKYELRHFDTPLIIFSATNTSREPEVEICWITDTHKDLLPLGLEVTNEGIANWLKHRVIPKNRAFVEDLLTNCGLSINRPMNIINISKGLSVNDCYWVVEENFNGKFKDYNLYDNKFNRALALIAFTGYGSYTRSSLKSCPEFTTNGMLPKCWRRINGKIYLYKGGTSGFSNTGCEPYSEFLAPQIAKKLGINAIDYGLSMWKGILCSTCELFTNKDISFVPIGKIVQKGGFEAVERYYKQLGPAFEKAFNDMLVFDAIICNTDRHYGNFGLLVDSKTNKIVSPAPLFDHGNSLFNFAGDQYLETEDLLTKYADSREPATYDNFIKTAKEHLDSDLKNKLRKLLNFHFKKHSRYNLDNERMIKIEHQIQRRAKLLLYTE